MQLFLWIAVCLLASVGLVQVMGWLVGAAGRACGCASCHVVPLQDDPARVEMQLRGALLRLRWNLSDCTVPLLLLDRGLGGESLEICERMLWNMGGVYLCTPEQLPALVNALDDLRCDCAGDGL